MRLGVAIAVLAALLLLVSSMETVRAAGYERYDTEASRKTPCERFPQTQWGLYDAVKKASFVDKCPHWIDEIAFTIKDIISQFGLTNNTTR